MPILISNLYAFGEFRLNVQNRVLRLREEPIALTPKAFEVLLFLIQHSGEIVSKEALMRAVWPESFVEESNVTQTVFMVRKALRETPEQRYILTVQGRGYRFVPDVKEVSENGRRAEQAGADAQSTELATPTVPLRAWTPADTQSGSWQKAHWRVLAIASFVLLIVSFGIYLGRSGARSNAEA